jgi:flavin-dependent dehydrogenase
MSVYDVIVAGGGAAGVGAAVGAAQAGARTLLIERGSFLGGAATLRSVTTYCGLYLSGREGTPSQAVFGVAEEVLERLRRINAVTPPISAHGVYVVFDPEALKVVLDHIVADAGVDVMFHDRSRRARGVNTD